MANNVDITLLAKLCQDALAETKAMRLDLAAVQQLAVRTADVLVKMEQRNEARFAALEARFGTVDDRFTALEARLNTRFSAIDSRFAAVDGRLRGIDLRIGDLRDGLELTIKTELMSALGNFETKMLALIDRRLAGRQ